ncbi:hypothetical protein G5I_06971 [Acromyrmex echinatior]|uniref:Uncharacterized protein n=1 Tax=Acromyrmex echinatior TaxID=103372 RepID=F4WMD7_ACREC|nr:hypothetical protein G5I_06971 [Acromyrmex echinatior]
MCEDECAEDKKSRLKRKIRNSRRVGSKILLHPGHPATLLKEVLRVSRWVNGDGMRTLVRTRCGSSEEEDEDGGGRDGPWSVTDEDLARGPRRRSPRGSSQNSKGRATDRWVS